MFVINLNASDAFTQGVDLDDIMPGIVGLMDAIERLRPPTRQSVELITCRVIRNLRIG